MTCQKEEQLCELLIMAFAIFFFILGNFNFKITLYILSVEGDGKDPEFQRSWICVQKDDLLILWPGFTVKPRTGLQT